MGMGVVRIVIYFGVATSARMNHLPRSQDRTTVIPLPVARCRPGRSGRELFAHIIRQTQAAAGASVAVGKTTAARGFLGVRGILMAFEEVGMIFDLRRWLPVVFVGPSAWDKVGRLIR